MKKLKKLTTVLLFLALSMTASAQRFIDNLDRGVVAVKTSGGVFVSWRIQSDEYYDVTYNLYRDGSKIAENLKVSNFNDAGGSTSSTYSVAAVVNGQEQEKCDAQSVWANDYLEITPKHPSDIKSTLVPNDACCADVDGDGQVEILMKYDNQDEVNNGMQKNGWYNEHTIFEVLELDGTVKWWVNCGPNMGDFQNNEQNIVGYDWDQDGKAEVLMRLEEGSVIHMADGSEYKIGADGKNGTSWTNYREPRGLNCNGATVGLAFGLSDNYTASSSASWLTASIKDGVLYATVVKNETEGDGKHSTGRSATVTLSDGTKYSVFQLDQNAPSVEWFTHYGKEFLVYCNGATGEVFDIINFPCARLESDETDLNAAWGDGYGHRSNKFFFGAPYLNGRNPSIFVGRGIYTRHKFVALDVDKSTHKLSERWRWMNNQGYSSPWYGQGYHNYAIVDVDWDGRDEIVFGGLVIDDNGMGLSTAGFGHGDAQHHGDLNPYIHGQEGWFCNEDRPSNHYRDLTTAKLYYRNIASNDDGRAIAGNFSNTVPGAIASSARDYDNAIGLVANQRLSGYSTAGMAQNFRCYWDADLCEETFNYVNGKNTEGAIYKYGGATLKTLTGSMTNNDTKGTPSYMGDILGDWREEFIMRTADNKIRVYTTTIETPWRNYSLWYDHQYRNGMVWEMCGYNQPPHTSYFLGEYEGITAAPPALTMKGRTEVANGGTINGSGSVITCETNDMTVSVADGATPYIYIDNAPSWVQGSAPSEATASEYPITYKYYTHTLTGGAFAGDMRLVKQGDGALTLPDVVQTYSGNTEVWAGTLNFNGTLQNSRLWLNRFAELNTDGGTFSKSIQADYASIIRPGGKEAKASTLTTDSLILNFGAVVELDIYSDGFTADQLNAKVLKIEKKDWENGPEYSSPVFRVNAHAAAGADAIADGKYVIGTIGEVKGSLDDILIENLTNQKAVLSHENGQLCMTVTNYEGIPMTWKGDKSADWNLDGDANFVKNDGGDETKFFTGSQVTFNDAASVFDVNISGKVAPREVIFDNTKQYTLSGDSIVGQPEFLKQNTGTVYLNNLNRVGNTTISGGTLYASSFANSIGSDCGSLGTIDKTITLTGGGALAPTATFTNGQKIICANDNGIIHTPSGVTFTQAANIQTSKNGALTKTGAGTLIVTGDMTANGITVSAGTYTYTGTANSKTITLQGTAKLTGQGARTSPIVVAEGANVTWDLPSGSYTDIACAVSGSGTITVNTTNTVNRTRITGNWNGFTGTVNYTNTSYVMPIKTNWNLSNATLNIGEKAYVAAAAKTCTIGKLTGKGVLEHPVADFNSQAAPSGTNTWRVGNSSETLGDFTFDGYLYDAGGTTKANFEKIGSCTMTVSTAWQNSGTVKISAGELHCNNKITLGTGALTVADGATLSGSSGTTPSNAKKNPFTNSSLTVNGTLWPMTSATSTSGIYWGIGTMPVSFSSTGIFKVGLSACTTDTKAYNTCLVGDGSTSTVSFADGATIETYITSYVPTFVSEEVTDSFKVLYNIPNINVAGKLNYILPTLPQHYYWKNRWDNTLFAKTGCLYVGYLALPGDANRDNKVTMADANMVVNYFLSGVANGISLPHADVNGDGIITMADANAIVNIFLGNSNIE